MGEFTPVKLLLIDELETLKIIVNPLRIQIVESLIAAPLTVAQVAERLGLTPSKLYYHVNLLEEHGLIKVVEERQVANIIEKLYRAAAEGLEVDPALLSFATREGQENVLSVLAATLDATREEIIRSMEARAFALEQGAEKQPRKGLLNRAKSHIDQTRAAEFAERLQALMEEFEAADSPDSQSEDMHAYALLVAFYPCFYYPDEDEPESS